MEALPCDGILQADAVAIESASSPGNAATWTPTITQADKYEVFARIVFVSDKPQATNARYLITHGGVTDTVTVDQANNNGSNNGQWVSLGTYTFTPGTGDKIQLSDHANGVVAADAIQLRPVANTEQFATWQGTAATAGAYQVYARWPASSTLATDAKYKLTTPTAITTMPVNQRLGGGAWHLLGNVTLAANDNWRVDLSDQASGAVAADAVAVVPAGTADTFTWPVPVPRRGSYQLYATWSTAADRATDATYQIHASSPGTVNITVDQSKPNNGWRYLGNYTFDPADANVIVLSSSLTGSVSADAIRVVGSGNAAGVSFILTDQLGQPQKLTDASKAVVWDRLATPYGETISLTNPGGIDQPLRFPGQQLDATTSLAYNDYRDYDASLGRYIQSDPIGLGGGLNTYAYVGGNPTKLVDPMGLESEVVIWEPAGWGESSFGHASAEINGTSYSFGPNGEDIRPFNEYQYLNGFRYGFGLVLRLTSEEEDRLKACLATSHGDYNWLHNSCTDPIEGCLRNLGYDVGDSLTPTGLGGAVMSNPNLFSHSIWYEPTRPSEGSSAPWAK